MKPSEVLKFERPLWKHQADCIDRFSLKSEAALLHECGTGKTTTAIGWCRTKYGIAKEILPTLIVSPVATLENWRREFELNSPEKVYSQVVILAGSEKRRTQILKNSEAKILVTNPEAFDMREVVAALRQKQFSIAIIDEAHRFKNPKSKRLGALLSVTDFASHRMLLTGTPVLNSYMDLWSQWRILDLGKTFGLNFFVFREQYFRDANLGWKGKSGYFPRYVPRPECALDIYSKIEEKASRITKAECLSLPPLVYTTEYVPMSAEQSRAYKEMETQLLTEVSSGTCVASNALTRVLRMLQILSGYVQVDADAWDGTHRIKDNPRLQRLKELLEELTENHKVIVWCVFQENYKAIQDVCESLRIGSAELTGQTKDRQKEIDRFQTDPECRVMISNPQAGGVGVNLTAASYAIYYSRTFSLGDRLQSEARNHRGGSEIHDKITLIDLVVKDTLDEEVLSALKRKESFSDNILERLQAR